MRESNLWWAIGIVFGGIAFVGLIRWMDRIENYLSAIHDQLRDLNGKKAAK